jgi:hypothetical protein
MIPEIPDRYWKFIRIVLTLVGLLTFVSMMTESTHREKARKGALQLEMAKKNYCLTTVVGSAELQYQPCPIRVER